MKKIGTQQGLSLVVLALLAVAMFTIAATPQESSEKKNDKRLATSKPAQPPKPGEISQPGKTPKRGDVKILDLGGGVKMELVWITAGSFQMGSPDSEQVRSSDEGPVHTVELDGFWMGKHEVTQEQYEVMMGSNPSNFKGAQNPVEQVSWIDAADFCFRLTGRLGGAFSPAQAFRLPTEAEWEYACRAGSTTRFCFGDSDDELGDYAWYNGNSGKTTHPVAQKKANDWGLYDMHGNVWEWCADWYGDKCYGKSDRKNPEGPSRSSGGRRVTRGGASWLFTPDDCRSAARDGASPTIGRISTLGFRVVAARPREREERERKARESYETLAGMEKETATTKAEADKRLRLWKLYVQEYGSTEHQLGEAEEKVSVYEKWTAPPQSSTPSISSTLGTGKKPITVDLGGGVKMELVWVPAGSFQMGSPQLEQDQMVREGAQREWVSDEGPVHTVELDGFWMGRYEVTQEQYRAVMGKNPSKFRGEKHPVEYVSWNNATDFCRKATAKVAQASLPARSFRLPTEAEWEYACRAGSTTRFCFGDSEGELGDYAWYAGNSGNTTHPVGEKKPNKWGLYDMHGNVWEWCGDWYGEKYYGHSDRKNPKGPSSGDMRVFRGGSWHHLPNYCRSADHNWAAPPLTLTIGGFRVVFAGSSSR